MRQISISLLLLTTTTALSCSSTSRCLSSDSTILIADSAEFSRSGGAAREWVLAVLRGRGVSVIPADCGVPRHPALANCAWFRLHAGFANDHGCVGAAVHAQASSRDLVRVAFQSATGAAVEESVVFDVAVNAQFSRHQLTVASLPDPTRTRIVARTRRLVGGGAPRIDEMQGPAIDSLLVGVSENELRFAPAVNIGGAGWSIDLSRWFANREACERSRTVRGTSPEVGQERRQLRASASDASDAGVDALAPDASIPRAGVARAPSPLERICRSGTIESRPIDRSLIGAPVAFRRGYPFAELNLSDRPNGEPEAVLQVVWNRHSNTSIHVYYRNSADDRYWGLVGVEPEADTNIFDLGAFLGHARVQTFLLTDPFEHLVPWNEWRRIAFIPVARGQVRIFVQCGAEVRSQLYYLARTRAHWCTLTPMEYPDAERERIGCIRWMREHPLAE